jgi:membrane fusion protein (multidrug efflux system)
MRLVLILVSTAVLLGACGKGPPTASGAPAAAASSAARASGVPGALLISPEDLRTVGRSDFGGGPVVNGTLQPGRRADLRAEIGALVQQVLKDNGEAVRTGELIVRLDDSAIRDSLASAEESQRAATQAFDQTERVLARQKTLQAQGMTSTQALEDAELRRNNAQSELVAARARVASARQQLRRTEVRAPFDGVVSERKVSAGDTAQVGKELFKVIDPASLRFEGLVSADRLHELQVGQAVSFKVAGAGPQAFAGRLRRIDAAANATTRQVEVIIAFADPAKAPRVAGLFAEGRIETGIAQRLVLPEASIVRSGEQAYAWRVDGQALRKVALVLGPRDARSGDVEVRQGLSGGDRVLRNPAGALADGQAFEWAGAAAAALAASRSAR